MFVLRVILNGDDIGRIGAGELDVLTFGLLRPAEATGVFLQLTGMSKSTAKTYQWLNRQLQIGDQVRLIVSDEATVSQYPTAEAGSSESNQFSADLAGIDVTLPLGDRIRAIADIQQNLQATATWTRFSGVCSLAIGAIRIRKESQNESWFETAVNPGDEVLFGIVAQR